jgi:crotonobetainyl-CoA:carnitine CoA-transferase CaiB-like acyl-CoA transferase
MKALAADTAKAPLAGYRILDLSNVIMGPFATQILADLGAEVMIVEPPEGMRARLMGPGVHRELSGVALNLLRNKRSISVDLKHPAGTAAVVRLAATCDVVVTNLRSKALARLGLGYQDLREGHPDLIYCHGRGFSSASPRSDDVAYDDIIQAECGLADLARRSGRDPGLVPSIVADKICGIAIAQAVTTALLHRERTGQGQLVEVPMLDMMQAFVLVEHGAGRIASDDLPVGFSPQLAPERGPLKTKDGWMTILPHRQENFDLLFAVGGRPDLVGDPRSAPPAVLSHVGFLFGELRAIFGRLTTAEWLELCVENDIPAGPVVDLEDIVMGLPMASHPHAGRYREIPFPLSFHACEAPVPKPAPLVGEQTRELLGEAGYDLAGIAELIDSGAVRVASAARP